MKLIYIILGIFSGLWLSEYTSVYRLSCDKTKFGYEWTTQSRLRKEPFICKDSNQVIERETDLYMIYQIIKLELIYTNGSGGAGNP